MSSKFLMKKKPLVIDPQLAELIGLNESIILQQIEYWLENKKENNKTDYYINGRWWVYNTHKEWKKQFPFWSVSTIRRTIKKLNEEMNILIVDNFNKKKFDQTKWYSINYKNLDDYCNDRIVQNEQKSCSKRTEEDSKMNRPIPESTTKNTTKNKNKTYSQVIDFKNQYYMRELQDYVEKSQLDLTNSDLKNLFKIKDNGQLIEEALKRLDKPHLNCREDRLKYAKTILRNWNNDNVNSVDDLIEYEQQYYKDQEYKNNDKFKPKYDSMENYS